jgi:spore germination cell wall hydrolase CwlJ-like protein
MRWAVRGLLVLLLSCVTTTLAVPPKAPDAPIAKVISSDDICFAWVIHDEARGEPLTGQRAVYDVVKHRMTTRNLTACEVVKQKHQFSGYRRGMRLKADDAMLERLGEVRKVKPVVPNASYFHSKQVKPTWASKMKRIFSIGGHVFYRNNPKEKQK